MRIKPLERVIIENREDGTQVSRLPNTEEMMGKINRIIEVVNELDVQQSHENHKKFVKAMTSGW
ncbi:hypothetical protein [Schinkia azotoformans]|uniref:hypothetical protein n=1 Tax=Schinkia azotoformans TaxID=1454 RepID=UPI002DBDBA13|nr:hypothetical protein [Schinkia azotoformans]MEC1744141.1 hypothetical protein [Schinkia azotoformans]